jgi:hypothetical protein
MCTVTNAASATVYGQVYVAGLTDTTEGPAPGITAEIGFGPPDSDPRTAAGWIFSAATVNTGNTNPNNDEYQATLPAQGTNGSFSYVYRFKLNGGPPLYCDTNGTNTDPPGSPNYLPFSVADLGKWTVAGSCPLSCREGSWGGPRREARA